MSGNRTLSAFGQCLVSVLVLATLSACGSDGADSTGEDEQIIDIALPDARGLLPALATYQPAFEGTHHSGSASCSSCHNAPEMTVQGDAPGELRDVSIGTAWETSVMAQSTRDPYWHAIVASELDNFPGQEDEINDKCLVCHAPAAHDLAAKEGLDLRLFDKVDETTGEVLPGIYSMDSSSELFNHAMDGVTCTLCHQMDGANFGTEESMTGGYIILPPPALPENRPAYGQYEDPNPPGYMQQQSGFNPLYGPHLSTSESCATCHNLNIAPIDPQGNALPGAEHFAEQAIYTEWLVSDYAIGGPKEASCQACHMPVLDEDVYIASPAGNVKRPDFAEHTFLGANTVMQDMFKNFAEELGIDPNLDFDAAIARNREFLKTSATVTLSQGAPQSGKLNFDVTIENHTGHKLPGGYHSRRVYLHVQVLNAGDLVFESGRMRPDGSIVGVAEDVNPAVYEPHYDLITDETQVQVYQSIVSDVNGDRTHSLLAGVGYLKDNRLTPSGFDKVAIANDPTLPSSFGTFGQALFDDDFNDGRDVVSYQIDIPPEHQGAVFTVVADLRYQPLSYGHLEKLWTQGDRVDQVDMFRTIYEATTLRDEFIDTDTLTMQ